jgi:hypothetical protein
MPPGDASRAPAIREDRRAASIRESGNLVLRGVFSSARETPGGAQLPAFVSRLRRLAVACRVIAILVVFGGVPPLGAATAETVAGVIVDQSGRVSGAAPRFDVVPPEKPDAASR